jgi:hypothetical protein
MRSRFPEPDHDSPSQWFPIINLVYDFLFDVVPPAESVEKILNVLGLVTALMLGVVLTIPASVNHAELAEANSNFNNNLMFNYTDAGDPATFPVWYNSKELAGFVGTARDTPGDPTILNKFGGVYSSRLAYFTAGSVGAFTSALLSIVLVYFFLAAGDWDDGGHNFGEWWQLVKWLVLQQFIATAVGIVLFFITLSVLMDIKFPDDACTMDRAPWLKPVCIHAYFFWNVIIVLYATVGCVLLVLSAASTKRYLYDHRRNAWLAANPDHQFCDYEVECSRAKEPEVVTLPQSE